MSYNLWIVDLQFSWVNEMSMYICIIIIFDWILWAILEFIKLKDTRLQYLPSVNMFVLLFFLLLFFFNDE